MNEVPTRAELAELVARVIAAEKPSGRFKVNETPVAADGTVLSRAPRDPTFFVGGAAMRAEQREALLAANSARTPTCDGLTWKDFSEARGYSSDEIADMARLRELCAHAALGIGELLNANGLADYECDPQVPARAAARLHVALCAGTDPERTWPRAMR